MRVLAINGSYRDDGITDQAVKVIADTLQARDVAVDVLHLRDEPIEFCLNCRECTQQPGATPGHCVIEDGMHELIRRIEASDAFILASPTNFYNVTALFKRFLERLAPYAYWPWGQAGPKYRKAVNKKAIIVTSSAAPAFLGRLFFGTTGTLKLTARAIGAKPVATVATGMNALQPDQALSPKHRIRLERAARKLL